MCDKKVKILAHPFPRPVRQRVTIKSKQTKRIPMVTHGRLAEFFNATIRSLDLCQANVQQGWICATSEMGPHNPRPVVPVEVEICMMWMKRKLCLCLCWSAARQTDRQTQSLLWSEKESQFSAKSQTAGVFGARSGIALDDVKVEWLKTFDVLCYLGYATESVVFPPPPAGPTHHPQKTHSKKTSDL